MKVLHTADWHLGQFKGPVEDGVNMRSLDTVKCLEAMVEKAKEEHPDMVVVSGDIFHQEQIGPNRYSDEVLTASRIIEELSSTTNFVVVMRGTPNHDGGGQFRVLRSLLAHNRKVSVITEPQVLRSPIADVVVIPGFDKQEFRAKFPGLSSEEENLRWTKYITDMVTGLKAQCTGFVPAILMSHYTVPGCNMESGQISFFSNFEPVIPQEALRTAGYDGVFLGHIHRPQQITGVDNTFYSGAINTLNFNDEGQERGFWIHEFKDTQLIDSQFKTTPYRKFKTITLEQEKVVGYIRFGKAYLTSILEDDIEGSIVRVKYTCTSEQKKELNVPMLQKDLYDLGAFYVSDIEAEATLELTNRGLLAQESDPLSNLKKWLDEKQFQNADKIVELAEPIIAAAMKEAVTADIHGVFKPVSIAVKNYRNYKDESFNFSDVNFCTINGQNGAGKSSLFMDAIVDALYEETREGDGKAWIRGTEDARSGSIEFIFEIGESKFRVVRTRMKSGRGTLNLSQMNETGNEWVNLSKERLIDTQAEIERVLGMDSMTFRSCALIMQDQYGLFLQAKKADRMTILGNLLGLGIYQIMEVESGKKLKESRGKVASIKEQVRTKQKIIDEKGNPDAELEQIESAITAAQEEVNEAQKQLAELKRTRDERTGLSEEEALLVTKIREVEEKISTRTCRIEKEETTIRMCTTALNGADLIHKGAEDLRKARATVQEKSGDKARYDAAVKRRDELIAEIETYTNKSDEAKQKKERLEKELSHLNTQIGEDVSDKLAELVSVRKELAEMDAKRQAHLNLETTYQTEVTRHNSTVARIESSIRIEAAKIEAARKQEAFLKDSGCPNIATASCKFLSKAKEDVEGLPILEANKRHLEASLAEEHERFEGICQEKEMQDAKIGYDAGKDAELRKRATNLSKYETIAKNQETAKLQKIRIETELSALSGNIEEWDGNVFTLNLQALTATETVDALAESVDAYEKAVINEWKLAKYEEAEKELPVHEERRKNANENKERLEAEKGELEAEASALNIKKQELYQRMLAYPQDLDAQIMTAQNRNTSASRTLMQLNTRKGALEQQISDMEQQRSEISALNKQLTYWAEHATWYETLKAAFSQNGVPHQIVRNIIPLIENVANNILGQMTGGNMGVEFKMEREVKGKDGDKATLDVLINEYGKTILPYSSKSGGEKVKASLAVILALAEIKTGAAGIQLGMLFIDEPPFLDNDGTQAYVDSLETIRERYPDVKIMAITHDESMKARFTQSVTVIKTEEGSKVIY